MLLVMKTKKELGQNFLISKVVVEALLKAAEINKESIVLEIGPGKGFVTEELAKVVKKVIAVEFDSDLIVGLKNKGWGNVEIINKDILRFLGEKRLDNEYKVVGSIPYQITSPLIHKLLTLKDPPSLIALLIQYEVGKKITASPPNANYLSNFVQASAETKFIKKVKRQSFVPQPKVNGGIITIRPTRKVLVGYSGFLHKAFKTPRKMLNKAFNSEILESVGINPKDRPSEIPVEKWISLYNRLRDE